MDKLTLYSIIRDNFKLLDRSSGFNTDREYKAITESKYIDCTKYKRCNLCPLGRSIDPANDIFNTCRITPNYSRKPIFSDNELTTLEFQYKATKCGNTQNTRKS